jgi:hypothetical protein
MKPPIGPAPKLARVPLVVALVVAACSPAASPSLTPMSPTVTPSPTAAASSPASPSPSVSPVVTGWQLVPDQPSLSGLGELTQVVWTGSLFIAAGPGTGGQAFLDSPDGRTWHLQPTLGQSVNVSGLAVGRGGLVAVGTDATGPMSWHSTDGLTWTAAAIPAAPDVPGDAIGVAAVSTAGDGWIAMGTENQPCEIDCDLAIDRAMVWVSADAVHWARQPDSPVLRRAAMTAVVRGGSGFVAVGRAPRDPASMTFPADAVVWTSADGQAWSRVPDSPVFQAPVGTDQSFGAGMTGVAAGPEGLVAVGTVLTQGAIGSALAWWSADAQTWSRAEGERFLYGQLFTVATVPGGFLATGPSGEQSCLGGIWSSTDGRSWACVASDPSFQGFAPYAAAASSAVEVVVGLTTAPPKSAVWVRGVP